MIDVTPYTHRPTLINEEVTHINLHTNKNVFYGRNVVIDLTAPVHIEEGVIIGNDVEIIRHTHSHGVDRTADATSSQLIIRQGALIYDRAIILEKCKEIGEWAVIGAGSVVTHNVPDHELWVGNPARFLRKT